MTIVGKNEIYHWESLVGPFLVHKLLGPTPPPSPFWYFPAARPPPSRCIVPPPYYFLKSCTFDGCTPVALGRWLCYTR